MDPEKQRWYSIKIFERDEKIIEQLKIDKSVIDHITLPGALFMAALAVIPSIIFYFTGNQLIQAFGGTSILIMIGVALDTMMKVESQLKMHNYEGFFK